MIYCTHREGVHHQLLLSHKNSGPENLDEKGAETSKKRLKAMTEESVSMNLVISNSN